MAAPDGVHETIAYLYTPQIDLADEAMFGAYDLTTDRWSELRSGVAPSAPPVFDAHSGSVLVGFGKPATMTIWQQGGSHTLPGTGEGRAFFDSARKLTVADASGTLAIWDIDRLGEPERAGAFPAPAAGYMPDHELSPRGDLLASRAPFEQGVVLLTDLGSGQTEARIVVPTGDFFGLTFLGDGGQLIISDFDDEDTYRYDIDRRTLAYPIPGRFVSASPNGRFIAVATNEGRDLRVVDLSTGAAVANFSLVQEVFNDRHVVISPDGRFIIIHGVVFDLPTQQFLRFLPDLDIIGSDFAFDPSGDRLYRLRTSTTTVLSVLDTATWDVIGVHPIRKTFSSQLVSRTALEVSDDGKLVYAAGELLDAASLTVLGKPGELLPQDTIFGDSVFTTDGRSLLLVSGTTIYRLIVDGHALADEACARAGRNLSADERSLYLSTSSAPACRQWPAE